MRGLILLGCVVFATGCDLLSPEDATTVRIVDVTMPATRTDPVLLRIQNIGPAGVFHAVAYEERIDAGYSASDIDHVRIVDVCSQVPTAIEANATVNTQIPGCGNQHVDFVVIYSSAIDGRGSATTACYGASGRSCPWNFDRGR